MKPATTLQQLAILEHAVGLPNLTEQQRRRYTKLAHCYRNHFVAGPDHSAWTDLVVLEQRGLMRRRDVDLGGGLRSALFWLTEAGFDVLRAHGRVPAVQRELFAGRSG